MDRDLINKARHHKLILLILSILMVSIFGMNKIYAKNVEEGSTEVSFAQNESDAFELSVTVTGSGQLRIGDIIVRETSKVFNLKVDESMDFKIEPDKGGKVEEVKLNGIDVTAKIQNSQNQINIQGSEKPQRLEVKFMKIKNQTPSTGVIMKTSGYIAIIALSSGALLYLISKKRKDSQSDVERESEKNV